MMQLPPRLPTPRRWFTLSLVVGCSVNAGCQSYHPKRLDAAAVNRALTVPADDVLAERAGSLDHPILRAIVLDDRDGLSPDEAAVLAVILNPSLRALRDTQQLAAAQTIEAGLLPNPVVSASLGTPTGGDTNGMVNPYGFGLSWDITSLIGHQHRIDAADASGKAINLNIAWREWQTAQAARLAVMDLLIVHEKITLTRRIETQARLQVEMLDTALAQGRVTSQTLASVRQLHDDWKAQRLTLEQDAASRRIKLNTLLGLPAERVVTLDAQSVRDAMMQPPDLDVLRAGLESRRLDLLALHRVYDSKDASLRAAVLSQFPRITIVFEHARDTDTVQTTGIGVSIDLPIFDHGQGRIARAKAQRLGVFDEYTSRVLTARNDVARLVETINHIDTRLAEAERVERASATLADRLMQAAEHNESSRDRVLNASVEQVRSALDIASLRGERFHTLVALELTSGLPMMQPENDERNAAP